ncbi:mycothiol transferase [Saccharopolyspora sp. NPDC000995]
MSSAEVLVDAFSRIREVVHETISGLAPDQLAYRVDPEANSIAWLVWHLTRVQDDHVSDVAEVAQVWTAQDWLGRFGLPFAHEDIGYGHDPDEVGEVRVDSGELLTGYHDAVHAQTVAFVSELTDDDLAEVADVGWTPPVTVGVRLVSVIADDLQHAGQAAFIRGIVQRTR